MTTKAIGLEELGLEPRRAVHHNLPVASLVERAIQGKEGILVRSGALATTTGERTGRSPDAKFTVDEPEVHDEVWWGPVNRPISSEAFDRLQRRVADYLSDRELYVFDGFAGADPEYRLQVRVVNEKAWHNLFAHQLFLRPDRSELASHEPEFTILHAPDLAADPGEDGTGSSAFVLLSLTRGLILIGGTHYAGEMKKSIFTVMNWLMPRRSVLPMHCSANIGRDGDTALFFGLSGTGKTTLSADSERRLIGDDEHGWSDAGVFNFEGGCYAKCIHLSQEKEPEIWAAIRFGSVLENVVVDEAMRAVDYDDDSITENTRAGYPVDYIPGAVIPGIGGHPRAVVFLTADAFGVLPPISRLSHEQAMYHFISGYTAKVAGTEAGVTEPKATFSACFGSPFLPLHPTRYAEMLGERLDEHDTTVWLVNTGWTGGPYGQGHRMELRHTRAMVSAALAGQLDEASYTEHPVFRVDVPDHVPEVPDRVLDPRATWDDADAYDAKARHLATLFRENFQKFGDVSGEIAKAGPRAE
ncbi:MAG TPA: phosphoenolpyruvate carboxykinase (ATP) [Gemmatimonadota bacterium]|nr:phosphoenolpyruvate carboxykinase (ATP) [Gemmatimonadota bacterium]